jgi:phytoene dehydrogenase-like protein
VWPPGSFWERRETGRLASTLPWISEESHREFLAEFPRDHDFRFIVEAPATFASHMVGPPPFAVARLHGAWTRGVQSLARGEEELVEFFAERVRAHGGDTKLNERVTQIHMKRGRVTGVLLDGEEVSTGVQFLVTDTTTRALLDLAGFEPSRRTLSNMPRLIPREHRFVVSMVSLRRSAPTRSSCPRGLTGASIRASR